MTPAPAKLLRISKGGPLQWWTCALGLVLLAPSARSAPSDKRGEQCLREAEDFNSQNNYPEAGSRAVDCWRREKVLLAIFRAIQYWQSAGYHAHAVLAAREYNQMSPGDDKKRIQIGRSSLDEELRHTGKVRLDIRPTPLPDQTIKVRALMRSRPQITFELSMESLWELDLDPGAWSLEVVREGFVTGQIEITVQPDKSRQTITVPLQSLDEIRDAAAATIAAKEAEKRLREQQEQSRREHQLQLQRQSTLKLGGGIAIGAGVALLSFAVGHAASVQYQSSRYEEICDGGGGDEGNCYKSYHIGQGINRTFWMQPVGFSLGSMLIGAGISMISIANIQRQGLGRSQVSVLGSRGGLGLQLERRF